MMSAVIDRGRLTGKRLLRAGVDAGVLGQRLDHHIVICGFPRSGTTMLQLMLESCVTDVDSFVGEVEALWACEFANRRKRWLVTKRPDDVFDVDALRAWYRDHPGDLAVVMPMRDPRDVLTSTHAGYPPSRGYYCEPERWQRVHREYLRLRDDADVIGLRYEQLVADPASVQADLDERFGWTRTAEFADFDRAVAPRAGELQPIDVGALGGVRPVDDSAVARWRADEHRERLAHCVADIPELAEAVRRFGYADDDSWIDEL